MGLVPSADKVILRPTIFPDPGKIKSLLNFGNPATKRVIFCPSNRLSVILGSGCVECTTPPVCLDTSGIGTGSLPKSCVERRLRIG